MHIINKISQEFRVLVRSRQSQFWINERFIVGRCLYPPKEGSKYTKAEASEESEVKLLELLSCNDALVCMCGDFNTRTGD